MYDEFCIGWGLLPPFKTKTIAPNARQLAFVYAGFRIKREGKQARIYGGKVLLCDSSLIKEKTMSKEKTKGLLAGERCGEKHTVSIASMRGMRFAEIDKRNFNMQQETILNFFL